MGGFMYRGKRRAVVDALKQGATTVLEVEALIDPALEMTPRLISAHLCSLVQRGQAVRTGSVQYGRSKHLHAKYALTEVRP